MDVQDRYNISTATLPFDVMLGEKWICTMRMPLTFTDIIEYQGDTPIYDISKIQEYIEKQRPSLTGKPYRVEFITGKPKFRD